MNFGPGVSPPRPKSEKSIMHRMVVSQMRQTIKCIFWYTGSSSEYLDQVRIAIL